MSTAFMDAITRSAHNAAARLFPASATIDGQTLDVVVLEPWQTQNELMPGYSANTSTSRVSFLKSDFNGRPRPNVEFRMEGKRGDVSAVSESAGNWVCDVTAYKSE